MLILIINPLNYILFVFRAPYYLFLIIKFWLFRKYSIPLPNGIIKNIINRAINLYLSPDIDLDILFS